MTLTKRRILNQITDELGDPLNQSSEITETLLEIIKSTLKSGEDVLVSGFCKFCVKDQMERKARNPAADETMILSARRVFTFKCSGKLRNMINGG